jgi:hypothetical protein
MLHHRVCLLAEPISFPFISHMLSATLCLAFLQTCNLLP